MRALILALTLLAACAPRGSIIVAPDAGQVGKVQPVYMGTTRALDVETGQYGRGRSEVTHLGRFDISVPPNRQPGDIRFTRRGAKPDPKRDFLTTGAVDFATPADFREDLAKAMRAQPRGKRDAVIYIHGFNNTFSEGLYRIAQLHEDLELPGVPVHYSWPSAGNPLGYVHDRDSATFARDGLEELMTEVSRAGAERILLVAHSMGSAVTMETLRQVAIRGSTGLQSRLSGVVLISPDIDVDVFRAQAKEVGKLPQPFLIFGSDRDRLLNLSATLTGQPERLGNLTDMSRVADLEVSFVDVAAFAEGTGHFALGDNPALIGLMARIGEVNAAFGSDETGRVGLLPGVVLTVQSATQIILAPVGAVAQELSR